MPIHRIRNTQQERKLYRMRVMLAYVGILCLSALLIARYSFLQINRYDMYATESDDNRILTEPVPPTRGLIYAQSGELLARSKPSYALTVIPERVGDVDELLDKLSPYVSVSDLQNKWFERRLHSRRRPYEPVIVRYGLTDKEVAKFAAVQYRFPGVKVQAQAIRYYPYNDLFTHSVGYVGRINDRELRNIETHRYQGTDTIGKLGVEKTWESELMGYPGSREVEVNARGRVLRTLDYHAPTPGEDLHLTIDMKAQQAAYDAMKGRRGAIVALDVKTGGVLALISTPSFNPNLFVTGISSKDYARLRDNLDSPFLNRAIQARYPPGSTVKPEIGLAGLHYHTVTKQTDIWDPGYFILPHETHRYRDWKRGGHGHMDFVSAIAESCDTYFYHLGYNLGIDKYSAYLDAFGFGKKTGIDLPSERSGILPSRKWKREARNKAWYPGDTINASIGQGFFLATPLQLAWATSMIASKGKRIRPHLVDSVVVNGIPRKVEPETLAPIAEKKANWDLVTKAMHEVTAGRHGTARRLSRGSAYQLAGKSGTAQVVGIAQGARYDADALSERQRDHALFVSFAPLNNPRIAVAVVVENGQLGSTLAGPIAKKVMDAWLLDKAKKLKPEFK